MIINENKQYTALAEEYGLRAWIKTATFKSPVDGEEYSVVIDLVITKADNTKEIVYRFNFGNNWMAYDNITTIILDVMNYLANTKHDKSWINIILERVFWERKFLGIKLISKQINEDKKQQKIIEASKKHWEEVKELKQDINNLVEELNNKDTRVRVYCNESTKYKYTIYTKYNVKTIERDYTLKSSYEYEIKQLKDTIDYLNKIKYCIDNDYDIDLMLDAV